MKLYLSSYRIGDHPEQLQKLVRTNKHAAVILNAQDLADVDGRAERVALGRQEMESLGFTTEELDLRDYFGKPEALRQELKKYGLLWIRGGNVFVLRRAMRQSGFDSCIHEILEEGDLVYAGFSAGSCAAALGLHGIELVDDSTSVPEGYDPAVVWDGLALVPYTIAPHYKSDHPESEAIDDVVAYLDEHHLPYKALHDGEAIVVND